MRSATPWPRVRPTWRWLCCVWASRTLLSALGEYDGERLPRPLRDRLTPLLLSWYRDDPDAGVHATVDWLLRHQMDGPRSRPLDWQQADALQAIEAERRGQPPQD